MTHVGLTALDMSDMTRLAQLAMNPHSGTSREEIYLAVASLYRIQGSGLNERERELMRDILRRLAHSVEMAIRVALAQRLAEDTTAPHDLILLLVDDRIEVARPLLLRSPLLTDSDALKLIAAYGVEHQKAIAERSQIGTLVTDALVTLESESVLLALVRNATAKISQSGYETLVQKSQSITGLQEPLIHRPDLPPDLAIRMCDWVSEALKSYIRSNYHLPAKKVEAAISEAATAMKSQPAPPMDNPADGAHRLIEKLAISDQLKAGFLMRVLSQGQADLFDLGFARLLGLDFGRFRKIFYEGGARTVALSCRAAGIDRSVFSTVFSLSRKARGMTVNLTPSEKAIADAVFFGLSRHGAASELDSLLSH